MKLSDLLVSYKQVNVLNPSKQIQQLNYEIPNIEPQDNKYQRMKDFISNKQTQKLWEAPKIKEQSVLYTTKIKSNNSLGYTKFNEAFDKYLEVHPEYKDAKNILTAIAAMESNYNQGIKNPHSSATGYFQFIDSTRKNFSNVSRDEFIKDPNNQFDAAVKYYRQIQNTLKPYQNKIKKLGLTPLQVVYGMWWNPKSVINYLNTGSDSYLSKSDGMTLAKIFNKAKNYENG